MGRVGLLRATSSRGILVAAVCVALAACGGGDSSPTPSANGGGNGNAQQPTQPISGNFSLAQSHIVAPGGAPFTFSNGNMPLTMVGNRAKLIRFDRTTGRQREYDLRLADLLRRGESEANVMLMPGDVIIILEAMKMETEVRTSLAGTVGVVSVKDGDAVAVGDTLLMIE